MRIYRQKRLNTYRSDNKVRLVKKLGILNDETQVKLCDSFHELFLF